MQDEFHTASEVPVCRIPVALDDIIADISADIPPTDSDTDSDIPPPPASEPPEAPFEMYDAMLRHCGPSRDVQGFVHFRPNNSIFAFRNFSKGAKHIGERVVKGADPEFYLSNLIVAMIKEDYLQCKVRLFGLLDVIKFLRSVLKDPAAYSATSRNAVECVRDMFGGPKVFAANFVEFCCKNKMTQFDLVEAWKYPALE
jgi:hypothetical protein